MIKNIVPHSENGLNITGLVTPVRLLNYITIVKGCLPDVRVPPSLKGNVVYGLHFIYFERGAVWWEQRAQLLNCP